MVGGAGLGKGVVRAAHKNEHELESPRLGNNKKKTRKDTKQKCLF